MQSTPYSPKALCILLCFLLGGFQLQGEEPEADPAKDPAPKTGIAIETAEKNGGLMTRFENKTHKDLGITYGKRKVPLRAGKERSVPAPKQPVVELKVYTHDGKKGMQLRYSGQVETAPKKWFLPLELK